MEGNALGIPGMVIGSVSTWLQAFLMVVQLVVVVPLTLWIKGISDRRKASTEALVAEDDIVDRQWQRFENECERLRKQISELEAKVDKFQKEVDSLRKERDKALKAQAEAEARALKLEGMLQGIGEGRQAVAKEESALRMGVRLPENMKKGK